MRHIYNNDDFEGDSGSASAAADELFCPTSSPYVAEKAEKAIMTSNSKLVLASLPPRYPLEFLPMNMCVPPVPGAAFEPVSWSMLGRRQSGQLSKLKQWHPLTVANFITRYVAKWVKLINYIMKLKDQSSITKNCILHRLKQNRDRFKIYYPDCLLLTIHNLTYGSYFLSQNNLADSQLFF